jgi:hypothetical protein
MDCAVTLTNFLILDKREKMNALYGKLNVSDEILLICVSSIPDICDSLKHLDTSP